MRMGRGSSFFPLAGGILLLGGLWGCADEDALYVDQPPWSDPLQDPAVGFLGYSDVEARETACSGCHPGAEAEWARTAHADAWAGLQESGHSQEFCEACHTVSALGNAVTETQVGWTATQDPRFHDVQCESCHGPGLTHVAYPAGEQPLAAFEASLEGTNGCGECHNGSHHPFVEQWEESVHGQGPHTAYAANVSLNACGPCHEGQKALEATFGEDANYLEKGDGEFRTITCVVCHDPHGSAYGGQLRAPIDTPDRGNLCMRCHTRRGLPWSFRGPHAAQGLLVLAEEVGYVPEGSSLKLDQIPNPHGPENNRALCTTCHVARRTITDQATGEFLLESVGHTFEAINCLDEDGLPDPDGICSVEERSFAGCTGSGCHGNETLARTAYLRTKDRLNLLLDELWSDSDHDGILESTDGGLLPRVLAKGYSEDLNPSSPTVTPAKGAIWNAMLAWTDDRPQWSDGRVGGVDFSSHPNSGNGVHNPHLLEALLLASIGDVREAYDLR
jgi:predicted CXXCH cytochrome family protein